MGLWPFATERFIAFSIFVLLLTLNSKEEEDDVTGRKALWKTFLDMLKKVR